METPPAPPPARDWFQEIVDASASRGLPVGNVPHVPEDISADGSGVDLGIIAMQLTASLARRDVLGVALYLGQIAIHASRVASLWGIDLRRMQAFIRDECHATAASGGPTPMPDDLTARLDALLASQPPIVVTRPEVPE